MTELTQYELIEDVYNNLVAGGMSNADAWTEVLTNYSFYEYKDLTDSPQDARLLNTRGKNIQWMLMKNDEMMRAYAEAMAIVLG